MSRPSRPVAEKIAVAQGEVPAEELAQHDAPGRLHRFDIDRRGFLKMLGGGILVCAAAPRVVAVAQESGGGGGRGRPEPPRELAAWLHIGKDGKVTAVVIGVGGFLGIGERDVAVNFESLRLAQDSNNKKVSLNVTKDSLKAAPEWQWISDRSGTTGNSSAPTQVPASK